MISIGITVRRRCASAGSVAAAIAFARSTVPMRVREESASMSGPGKAPSGASSSSRRASCCNANSSVASSIHVAVHGRDEVDKAQGCEGPACAADREHQARHDDGGGAVRTTAGDCGAGATPLWWRRGAERRGVAGDHEATRSANMFIFIATWLSLATLMATARKGLGFASKGSGSGSGASWCSCLFMSQF